MEYISGSNAEKLTFQEWETIHNEKIYQMQQKQRKIEARKKRLVIYYIKQKLSGLLMLALGILTPVLMDGDATTSIIFVPMGIFLLLTRKKVMDFRR